MAHGTIRIIGASPEAAGTWIPRLSEAGYRVDRERVAGPEDLKRLGREPPRAVVIDLDRAPARGRDIALALRQRVATRRIPIVLVASDRAVFARLKALPLETMQAAPEDVVTAVASALSMPPSGAPSAVPPVAGYSGTPLPRKLGIKAGSRVVLVRPPEGFAELLQPLPPDVVLRTTNRGARDITLWFTRSRRELERDAARMARAAEPGRLWIVWPKKASPLAADHSERDVRRVGIGAGLVDFKVCAVDADWSGLAFVRRRNGGAEAG
ncbi:MAG: hypothetical protein OXH04_16680 [Acidobacteria bacterium]|nr:hypothetical protein [Acidobacteriota bacterium]